MLLAQGPGSWPKRHVVGAGGNPVPLHLAQQLAYDSFARTVAMIAGTQSGKTSFEPWWLWKEIQKCGSGDYLAVTASYDMFKLKFLPEFLNVFERILRVGRYWPGKHTIELQDPGTKKFWAVKADDPMWGRIILRSAQGRGGLESSTALAAVADEAGLDAFGIDAYHGIRRRLHLRRGRLLIGTTLYNLEWVPRLIVDRATKGGVLQHREVGAGTVDFTHNEAVGIDLIQYDSIINPLFSIEEYEGARAELAPDEFAMQYRGRITKLRTLVFDCFDPVLHKKPEFTPPMAWPRMVGIDPMGQRVAALWAAWDDKAEQLHIYREYYEPFGLSTTEHAMNILRLGSMERILLYVGGGPSERQARADFSAVGIPLQEPPIADVAAQISRIYRLIKEGVLVIHENCEFLIDEIESYQYKRGPDGNPTKDILNKELYHLCLTGDTQISTENGAGALQDVRIGERVWTRQGLRTVVASEQTGKSEQVYTVCFSDGRTLTGTGNHPVWVRGRGFVQMSYLRYGDIIETVQEKELSLWQKKSSLTAVSLPVIQRPGDDLIGSTLLVEQGDGFTGDCIALSGSWPMGLSLKGTPFTIKMGILSTMYSKIWSVFQRTAMQFIMGHCSQKNNDASGLSGRHQSATKQKLGIVLRRGWPGTRNIVVRYGRSECLWNKFANSAARIIKRSNEGTRASAPTIANQHGDASVESITSSGFVPSADSRLQLIAIQRRDTAPIYVVSVHAESEPKAVYNLTVDGVHEYYANGVLVSNCDCLRYLAAWLIQDSQTERHFSYEPVQIGRGL